MGCCESCCGQKKNEYEEIKDRDGGGGGGGSGDGGQSQGAAEHFAWETQFLQTKTENWEFVRHAAIVSFPSGKLRASVPQSFEPNPTGVRDIISALQGDTSGLEQRSVALGGQTPVCTPGKFDEGKAIYCSDSQEGGCVILKSKECVLVLFYNGNAETAMTLATEMSEYLEENGR